MTVASTTNTMSYTGGGTPLNKIFPFAFKIFEAADLYVYVAGVLQTLNMDYTVPGIMPLTSGNVVFVTGPPAGTAVLIQRILPLTQLTDYVEGALFAAETHENALDRLTMIVQQLNTAIGGGGGIIPGGMSDPMTTIGDSIYRNISNVTDRLPIGTLGQIQTVINSGGQLIPGWVTPSYSLTVGGTDKDVQINAGGILSVDAGIFTHDYTKHELSILGSYTGGKVSLTTRNISAGTGSYNQISLGNDTAADQFYLRMNSSAFTTYGGYAYIWNKADAPVIIGSKNQEISRFYYHGTYNKPVMGFPGGGFICGDSSGNMEIRPTAGQGISLTGTTDAMGILTVGLLGHSYGLYLKNTLGYATGFVPGATQSVPISYTLPLIQAVGTQWLKNVNGVWSWADINLTGGGNIYGTGVAGQPAYFTGATTIASEAGTIVVVCTGTNDHTAIQAALDALPATGKIVKLIGPVAGIGVMLTIGNGGGSGLSTRNGITLKGVGGATYVSAGSYNGATVLQWTGTSGGTLLQVNGDVEGCSIQDLVLDGNNSASCLLDVNYGVRLKVDNVTGYKWQGGYAVKIHSTGAYGPGSQFQTWTHVVMEGPYGSTANGLDIAGAGSLNVSELTFNSCRFQRSGNTTSIGLRLGYADHIVFNRTLFDRVDGVAAGIGVQVEPISGHEAFPANITFIGSPIIGGVKYVTTYPWTATTYPALIFYPYYTADSQYTPPLDYAGNYTLPLTMVTGQTDTGEILGIKTLWLRGSSPYIRLRRPDGVRYWDIMNNENDSNDYGLSVSRYNGSTAVQYLNISPNADPTNPIWLFINGALQQVTVGAPDTGGTGYRLLRVPN